jgi:GTPase SAR1 family protein
VEIGSGNGGSFRRQTSRLLSTLDRTRELLKSLQIEAPSLPATTQRLLDWGSIDCNASRGFMANLQGTLNHLHKIEHRIQDSNSRLLFVGDVNAGKSTLVNSLLRKRLVSEDQQPCTALFVELLDASANNEGLEEIHAYKEYIYASSEVPKNDQQEYTRYDISRLQELTEDPEGPYQLLKVYCHDDHATYQQSLLRNGLADVSLIDSPGLNINTLTTMNLFSKQQEIDVIVFVISAENHITQSVRVFFLIRLYIRCIDEQTTGHGILELRTTRKGAHFCRCEPLRQYSEQGQVSARNSFTNRVSHSRDPQGLEEFGPFHKCEKLLGHIPLWGCG